LREAIFPHAVNLGDSAFQGCELLNTVDFCLVESLGCDVFKDCGELMIISLPALTSTVENSFRGWGGIGYSLSVPTAMAEDAAVLAVQAHGTTIKLL